MTQINERVQRLVERAVVSLAGHAGILETLHIGHMRVVISHKRATHFFRNPLTGLYDIPDLKSYRDVDDPEVKYNLITNVGRAFIHKQSYGTAGLGTCGLNFIALSNDPLTETATSTVLSNEITLNGLGRAQGAVTLATGAGVSTVIDKTFTATGAQSAQKCAFFDLVAAGTINHILAFTQRALVATDTLQVTGTLTIS